MYKMKKGGRQAEPQKIQRERERERERERDGCQQCEAMEQNSERSVGQSLLHSQVPLPPSRLQYLPLHCGSCKQSHPPYSLLLFLSTIPLIEHDSLSVGPRPQHAPHPESLWGSHLGRPSLRSFRQSGSRRYRPRSISSEPQEDYHEACGGHGRGSRYFLCGSQGQSQM